MFSEEDVKAEIGRVFGPDSRRGAGRLVAVSRGAFDVEVATIQRDKPGRFSLADILNANSRITIERFRDKLPSNRTADRIPSSKVAA